MKRSGRSIKPFFTVFSFAFSLFIISCSLEPPERSPSADMGLSAASEYENRQAGRHNADGIDHLVREHWRKAAADFRRALKRDPYLAVAHFNLAICLKELDKHAEAVKHFRIALERAPDDPRISNNRILKDHLE